MSRLVKHITILMAMTSAFYLTVMFHGSLAPSLQVEEVRAESGEDGYDLSSLRLLNRVVLLVKDNYVDQTRIHPQKMLVKALEEVERAVAEILVEVDEPRGEVMVEVDGIRKSFSGGDVDSLWKMSLLLREIFEFVGGNLKKTEEELRDIEYAAIRGMLDTLDPHSVILKPELYKEMKLGTRGEFGGLGIVISVRDGALTVISPIKETPAYRSGLKAMDKIIKINDESTINMDLNEAVSRLRGAPGTKVTVWILRKGWSEPQPFEIVRAIIKIKSVESQMLEGGVGYVSVKSFQSNTAKDLKAHIAKMKGSTKEFRGLILDMRNDPGGLLEQAITVSDLFLDSGVIVTTVGQGNKLRDTKKASWYGTEDKYPLVVLVNGGSASASEIVAGALKNNGRAVVLGNTTFGKGSVQVLYDFSDDSALKLTIAQYLTPGDISIQSVGITPDVMTVPVTIAKDEVDYFSSELQTREKDLDSHLEAKPSEATEKPSYTVRYLEPKKEKEGEEGEEEEIKEEEEFKEDFEIKLAAELIRAAKGWERKAVLHQGEPVFNRHAEEELQKISNALNPFGIDWSLRAPGKGKPLAQVKVSSNGEDTPVQAGEEAKITLTVTNQGTAPFYRLRAMVKCDHSPFKHKEFLLGKVDPGQTVSWTTPVKIPKDARTRLDVLKFEFGEAYSNVPDAHTALIKIQENPRPRMAFGINVNDEKHGNGDGVIQRGERIELEIEVTNMGPGPAKEALATLKNMAGKGIFISRGRLKMGELASNATFSDRFVFEVKPSLKKESFAMEIMVADLTLKEFTVKKFTFPIKPPVGVVQKGSGSVKVTQEGKVHGGADTDAPLLASAPTGAVFPVLGRLGSWVMVDLGKGHKGWIHDQHLEKVNSQAKASELILVPQVVPPEIRFDLTTTPLVVKGDSYLLKGMASANHGIRDMMIFVKGEKVFYKSTRTSGPATKLPFTKGLLLKKGSNIVTVVARQDNELTSRRSLIIQRQEGDGTFVLQTDKGDIEE